MSRQSRQAGEKNSCRDKENYVTTDSRSISKGEASCKKFGVATQDINILTRTKQAASKFCRDIIKVYRDRIQVKA